MKYSVPFLALLSLIIFARAIYSLRSYKKKNREYDEISVRPLVDPIALSDQIERSRKAAATLLFLCPFPIAFIQQLEGFGPVSLLLTKLSVGAVITLVLGGAKLLYKVPLTWIWSPPLSWKKQISAFILGLCIAWILSSAYTLLSDPNMRTQLTNTIFSKPGG